MKVGDLVRYRANDYEDIGVVVDIDTGPRAVTVLWSRQALRRVELQVWLRLV